MEPTKTTVKKQKISNANRGNMPRAQFMDIQRDLNSFTERDQEEYVAREKAKAKALKARS